MRRITDVEMTKIRAASVLKDDNSKERIDKKKHELEMLIRNATSTNWKPANT